MATFAENIAAAVVAIRNKLNGITNTVNMKVASVGGVAPIASTGGTSPQISISPATTSAAGSMSGTDKTKLDSLAFGFSAFVSGKPASGEKVAGGIAPYGFTIASGTVKALVGATASATFLFKRNGTQFGSATFAATGTTATVSFSSTTIAAGDVISIEGPATADATLSDISILLKG